MCVCVKIIELLSHAHYSDDLEIAGALYSEHSRSHTHTCFILFGNSVLFIAAAVFKFVRVFLVVFFLRRWRQREQHRRSFIECPRADEQENKAQRNSRIKSQRCRAFVVNSLRKLQWLPRHA